MTDGALSRGPLPGDLAGAQYLVDAPESHDGVMSAETEGIGQSHDVARGQLASLRDDVQVDLRVLILEVDRGRSLAVVHLSLIHI